MAHFDNRFIEYHGEFFRSGITAVIRMWPAGGCRETPEAAGFRHSTRYFNPPAPCGVGRSYRDTGGKRRHISIHPLRAGSGLVSGSHLPLPSVNPPMCAAHVGGFSLQSTRPMRGGTFSIIRKLGIP